MKRTLLIAGVVALFGIAGTVQAGGDVQAGKAKAGSCAGCHGAKGEGNKGIKAPALAGTKEDQLIQALTDYKSGKRANAMMKGAAGSLSEQDMANLAAYYASLK
jgi:cytochrome c553